MAAKKPRDRSCTTCVHLFYCPVDPGYSEYTPGSPMELSCGKNHWDLNDANNAKDCRRMLNMAPSCPDYKESDE